MNQKAGNLSIYIIILFSLLSIIPILSLRFGFNIENLLPARDSEVEFYKEFQNQFQSQVDEEEFIFIGLKNHTGIFHQGFLKKTESLTQYLSSQPQVAKVYSVTNSNIIFFVDSQIQARPLIHITQPELYRNDSIYLFQSKEYREHLVSSDGKTIAVAAFCKPHLTRTEKNELLSDVEQKLNGFGFDKTHLISKARGEKIIAAEIVKDATGMTIVFVLLLSALLFLMYRSMALMIFPLVVIVISNLWTLALFSLAGYSLDMLTGYLPLLITAASISVSIPITTNYLEALKNENAKWQSVEIFMKNARSAIYNIALLLVIGFLLVALCINVASLRIFFVFAAAGVLISSVVSILIFPVFASATPSSKLTILKNDKPRQAAFIPSLYEKILKNKRMILFVSLLLVVTSTFFVRKIESSSFISQIPKHSVLLEDYKLMEENFSGSRPFEMMLSINNKNQSFFNLPIMTMVEEIEVFLQDSCGVGALISPLSLFRGANKAFNKGEISGFVLPTSQHQITRFYEAIMQTEHADEMKRYMLDNGSRIRVSGRLPALSPGEFKIFSQKFGQFFNDRHYTNWFSYKMTGSAVLFDKTNEGIERNILIQFVVFFVMALAFCFYMVKSLKIAFLVFIAIVIPLLIMAALAGMLDMHLKTDLVIIVAVALIILVSNTFYFLSHFKSELSQQPVLHNALKNTYLQSSKALLLTNSILLILSSSLMVSGFEGIFQAGQLLSGCIIFSLIVMMILLPALVKTAAKNHFKPAHTANE